MTGQAHPLQHSLDYFDQAEPVFCESLSMNTDFRISIGFTAHPKTIKLMRRCGDRAVFCLLHLWSWVAQNKHDGDMAGMDDESIEIVAGWQGEPGEFVAQLADLGLIDGLSLKYVLHDWKLNQQDGHFVIITDEIHKSRA